MRAQGSGLRVTLSLPKGQGWARPEAGWPGVPTGPMRLHAALARRERQIMDILFRRGRATAAEVMTDLPGDPSYSTVRTQLRVLEQKGHVRHETDGVRFVYMPAVARH